jgi:hypothetical protein
MMSVIVYHYKMVQNKLMQRDPSQQKYCLRGYSITFWSFLTRTSNRNSNTMLYSAVAQYLLTAVLQQTIPMTNSTNMRSEVHWIVQTGTDHGSLKWNTIPRVLPNSGAALTYRMNLTRVLTLSGMPMFMVDGSIIYILFAFFFTFY